MTTGSASPIYPLRSSPSFLNGDFKNTPLPLDQASAERNESFQDSTAPKLYFRTFVKISFFGRRFFSLLIKRSWQTLINLPDKILDRMIFHFPKLTNVRRTISKQSSFTALDMQISDKLERHRHDLKIRLAILENCLKEDAEKWQNGLISFETHIMRYLQIASIKLAYSLDAAYPDQRIPLPCPFLSAKQILNARNIDFFYQEENSYSINLIINNGGLIAYGLEPPEGSYAPPILLIKGTSKTNLMQMLVDLDENIGEKAVKINKAALQDWIKKHTFAKPIICGHSLGGAISQIIGCKCHAYIDSIVTFASPSPGKKYVRKYKNIFQKELQKIEQKECPKLPEVYHFINDGDLIPYIGGFSSIPGHIFELEMPQKMPIIQRHGSLASITKKDFIEEQKIKGRKFLRIALETARLVFSFFLTWLIRIFAKKQTENLQKSNILRRRESIAATRSVKPLEIIHPPRRTSSII